MTFIKTVQSYKVLVGTDLTVPKKTAASDTEVSLQEKVTKSFQSFQLANFPLHEAEVHLKPPANRFVMFYSATYLQITAYFFCGWLEPLS